MNAQNLSFFRNGFTQDWTMHRAASSSPFSPREERVGRGPSRGEINKNAPPLPSPLLHPMEEREKSRSLMQPWIMQRLDSAGESPTGATEAFALRTAGVLARSNSTTNRIMNREQILDGKKNLLPRPRRPGHAAQHRQRHRANADAGASQSAERNSNPPLASKTRRCGRGRPRSFAKGFG